MAIVRNRRAWTAVAVAAAVVGFAAVGSGSIVSPAQGAASCPAGTRAVISGGVLSNPLICEVVIVDPSVTTWTPPAGVTSVDVIVVGGGGGGGGGAGDYNGWDGSAYTVRGTQILSGGGGGGGAVVHAQVAVSTSSPVTVTIGAGGATGTSADANGAVPASNGGDGGTTTFGTVSAVGGKGGKSGANGGAGGAAGGASGAAGGSGLQALQLNPQFSAGGGGGGAGGAGGNAEAVSVTYGTFTPQQDVLAGASGAKYAFVNDGSLWSSANFGSGFPNPDYYGLTYYPLGLGGVGGSSIVGGSSQCNETVVGSMRRQQGVSPPSYGTAACWYPVTNSGPFGNAATAKYNLYANYRQANAGAGGNGLVGNRGNQGTGEGNGGAVLIRFYADGGPVPTPVRPTPPTYTASTPPTAGTVGTAYDGYVFAASGTAPITFTSSGTLPPGLSLASDGTLSGTPTTAGTYTFTVTATNGTAPDATVTITITVAASGGGGGGGGGGGSELTPAPTPTATPTAAPTVTLEPLDPINNPDNGNVPPRGLAPGGSLLLVNGAPVPVTVLPNAKQDPTGLDVRGDDWSMKLVGRGDTSDPLGLTEKQVLILQSEQLRNRAKRVQPVAQASGTGFKASSEVKFYILPSTYLGSLMTDPAGSFSGTVPVPAGITPGSYTLQMNGYSPSSQVRSLSIGVVVKATSTKVRTAKASERVLFASMSADLTAAGKARLKALVKKTGTNVSTISSVGYVQKSGGSFNDQSLSTARARNVASYLRSLGLKGAYTVRGDGVGGPTAADRKVVVAVTYRR